MCVCVCVCVCVCACYTFYSSELHFSSRSSQVVIVVKTSPANAGDIGDVSSIPGSGRSPRLGLGNLLQYPCLENPVDRGTWWAAVHRVSKSRTRLKHLSTHTFCPKFHRVV